ncbi:MAG TPA: hypothetical protein DDW71_00555 [Lactobacillus sp.]|nr:hypothetical protein [Lactobacillus sp.]
MNFKFFKFSSGKYLKTVEYDAFRGKWSFTVTDNILDAHQFKPPYASENFTKFLNGKVVDVEVRVKE